LIISCLFLLIFAIFGVNYLKGTFGTCGGCDLIDNDESGLLESFLFQWNAQEEHIYFDTTPTPYSKVVDAGMNNHFEACPALNGTAAAFVADERADTDRIFSIEVCDCLCGEDAWGPEPSQNFDNVFQAFALLWEIASTEGWTTVMYASVDQRGKGMQHARDMTTAWVGFYWAFMVIGAFFVLELFVGVILDNFNKIKEDQGRVFMTEAQEEWAKTKKFIMGIKPERKIRRPESAWKAWCYDFVMKNINPAFDNFIMTCKLASERSE